MINDFQQHFNTVFTDYFESISIDNAVLTQALRYPCLNGGKRLRPLLVYAAGQLNNTPLEQLDNAAIATELIHCYSLVHDDLPCMDNDDLRRGKPTTHNAFNETIALLVGDALQTEAFTVLSTADNYSDTQKIKMIRTLANATGAQNMVQGQLRDFYITADEAKNNIEQLKTIYYQKTGALFSAAVTMGAVAADLDDDVITNLQAFAKNFGLAFQIQDDILDITSTKEAMGKTIGIDAKNKKVNYAELLGLEKAESEMNHFFAEATAAIGKLSQLNTDLLTQINQTTHQRLTSEPKR